MRTGSQATRTTTAHPGIGGGAVLSVTDTRVPPVAPAAIDTVAALFRCTIAEVDPVKPAITGRAGAVTYGELAARVRQAASAVMSMPGRQVGIALRHDVLALVGVLGALTAGRAFVPLDPALPGERLTEIASLADVETVLIDGAGDGVEQLRAALKRVVPRTIDMSALPSGDGPQARLRLPSDPACILFTSGSTGTPKGVVYPNRQLMHDVQLGRHLLGISATDRVGVALPYSFSAGLAACLWALTTGASLFLFDPRVEGAARLPSWVDAHGITTLHASPSLLRGVVSRMPGRRRMQTLRVVTTSGESLHSSDVEAARPHLPDDAIVVNWAGASEIASLAMHRIAASDPLPDGPLPAGTPVPGKTVSILADDGSVLPPGHVGEVLVTSVYLSQGYWRRDDLTRARYTSLPDGSVRYRTGDRGLLHLDGTLELKGRLDDAVKVRGYLVEPVEVENAIRACAGVAEAVVVVDRSPDRTRLVAYYVPAPGKIVDQAAVRRHLRRRLPEYMVPATLVPLAILPRDERGKVARSLLATTRSPATRDERPVTAREKVVAAVWCEVLGTDSIGPDDDFFALGGDSLAAIDMLAALSRRSGRTLTTADLVAAPTVAEFAAQCDTGPQPATPTLVPLQAGGDVPPLFFVAGAGDLGLVFRPLVAHLPEAWPAYGLQGNGTENRGLPDWTVAGAARRHLRAIRSVQPSGPYHLVGHSFGGLVAYELAQQLVAEGETVGLLGLLDTYVPWSDGEHAFDELDDRRPDEPAVALVLRRLSDRFRQLWATGPRRLFVDLVRHRPLLRHRLLAAQARIVHRTYRPLPYDGSATLWAADGGAAGDIPYWQGLVKGQLTIHCVEGDHHSLLRDPIVSIVARQLAEKMMSSVQHYQRLSPGRPR